MTTRRHRLRVAAVVLAGASVLPLAVAGSLALPQRQAARIGGLRLAADGAVAASALLFASWVSQGCLFGHPEPPEVLAARLPPVPLAARLPLVAEHP